MSEWISVNDRFPQNHDLVIITNGKDVTFSFFDHGFMYTQLPYIEKVSHWMPMPKPPVDATLIKKEIINQ